MYKIQYDEVSPITGNMSVLCEYDELRQDVVKLCMETGYQTLKNTFNPSTNPNWDEVKKTMPLFLAKTEVVDDEGQHWYMIPFATPEYVLYPDTSSDDFKWKIGKVAEYNVTSKDVSFVSEQGIASKVVEIEGGTFDLNKFSEAFSIVMHLRDNGGDKTEIQ